MLTLPSMPIDPTEIAWPAMPTETEIYILPDGRVVIADLPAELVPLLAELGKPETDAHFVDPETPPISYASE